jgi:hypothetical protein
MARTGPGTLRQDRSWPTKILKMLYRSEDAWLGRERRPLPQRVGVTFPACLPSLFDLLEELQDGVLIHQSSRQSRLGMLVFSRLGRFRFPAERAGRVGFHIVHDDAANQIDCHHDLHGQKNAMTLILRRYQQ